MSVDWYAILPKLVACQQVAFERKEQLHRLTEAGISVNKIAKRMGISSPMAGIILRRKRTTVAPVERYMNSAEALLKLTRLIAWKDPQAAPHLKDMEAKACQAVMPNAPGYFPAKSPLPKTAGLMSNFG